MKLQKKIRKQIKKQNLITFAQDTITLFKDYIFQTYTYLI
jgi:hypothetical protein